MYSGPATGLWTSPNPFSAVPAGSLKTADNVVFVAPSVIEPRRGFQEYAEFGTEGSLADAMAFYGVNLLLAYDFTRIGIKPPGGDFFNWAETFAPNGANRLRFESAARSVFFNPSSGIRVFDGAEGFFTGTISDAALRALSYTGGVGDIAGAGEVVGDISGSAGTILGYFGQLAASGTFIFSAVDAPFTADEGLTADSGWTGDAVGSDTLAVRISDYTAAFVPGLNIAGETSGATGVINAVVPDGAGGAFLGLREVSGTFVAERIAVGESTLEPSMAGCPQGLNIEATPTGDDGWQPPDTAVAYRFTVCRKDAFGRIIEGAPSGRTLMVNPIYVSGPGADMSRAANVVSATFFHPGQAGSGLQVGDVLNMTPSEANFAAGAKTLTSVTEDPNPVFTNVTYAEAGADATSTVQHEFSATRAGKLRCYFPDDCTNQHFLRVYRSETTEEGVFTPGDELFQCYESAYLSDADLAQGYVEFIDTAPEALLEVPLYTNPNTGDGTLAANFQPPIAEDLVYWQNRMWYLNTTSKHSAELALIGIGTPDGLQDGDEITILPTGAALGSAGFTFTAKNEPASVLEFWLSDAEPTDPGTNIARTAQAFCQKVNDYPAAPGDVIPYAFYISSESGQPGKILLVARNFGDAGAFSLYSSRPTAWSPQLPSNTAPLWAPLDSTNNRHAARLVYSKLGQPEAVPITNTEAVDADDFPGLKLAALKYRLIIFKTDGVYFVPTGFPVSLQKLSDHVLIAPDSVQVLGDAVYFLSDQGLMMVDDAGVRPVSIPIDDTLTALGAPTAIQNLRERTVGVAYRSARQYLLWTLERNALGDISEDNAQAFVYSTLSAGFTRFPFGVRAAAVVPRDFADGNDQLLIAPTGTNALLIERKSLTEADYYDVDEAPIETELVFNELTNGEPATMKMGQQVSYLFKQNSVPTITALLASEIHPGYAEVPLETQGWGAFEWGQLPWGGVVRSIRRVAPMPDQVANCCQLYAGLRASVAGRKFAFLGIDVDSRRDTKANRG